MSDAPSPTEGNVRSSTFYLVRATAECRHCRRPTPVLAFAMPPNHETLESDEWGEAGPLQGSASSGWERAGCNAVVFYIEDLPSDVQRLLRELSASGRLPGVLRLARSEETSNSYWANHCEHCDAPFGDHDLHCEPDGAFVPSGEADAASIHLLRIDRPFAASATGYSVEPAYFNFMSQS